MTGSLRAGSMTGERYIYEERTTDPATTLEGERWLRTDLAPKTNQIATLRVDVGSSVVDVPVFATGTSKSGVDEALRVRVGGQDGYIPITSPGDAAFNNLRMQHGGSTLAYHDRVAPGSAIPDSGILEIQESELVEPYSSNLEPHPEATNPVLDGSEATDVTADFAADPYILIDNGNWYMFAEYALSNGDQVISYLTSPDDGVTWNYQQVVLDTADKISFPYIFDHGNDYFMTVDDNVGQIELFKATSFPDSWSSAALIQSSDTTNWDDPVIFAYNNRYWCVAAREPGDGNRYIDVFYNDALEQDSWTPHANNPVITNRDKAYRPAGRPYVFDDGRIILFYMDGTNTFSEAVRAYEVTDISTSTWSETQVSDGRMVEGTGSGWNSDKMHHWDPWWQDTEGRWVVATDGFDGNQWSIGIYHVPTITNNSVSQI